MKKEKEGHEQELKDIEEENKKAEDDLLRIAEEEEEKRLKEEKALEDKRICKIEEQKKKTKDIKETKDDEKNVQDGSNVVKKDKKEIIDEIGEDPETNKGELNVKPIVKVKLKVKNIGKNEDENMKQGDGTNDAVNETVKGTESVKVHKIGLVVGSEDGLLDLNSDNLVIAEATVIESKNGKHVTFCCPGDEIGVMDKSVETEETVDIDTTLETNNTFESNTTLDTNVDTMLEIVDTGNYVLADTDEFAEDDEDYEFPIMQNVHRERYLKYKPQQDNVEEDVKEDAEEEGEEGGDADEKAEEEEGDKVDTR